jgi:hypothetical protein
VFVCLHLYHPLSSFCSSKQKLVKRSFETIPYALALTPLTDLVIIEVGMMTAECILMEVKVTSLCFTFGKIMRLYVLKML